MIRSMRWTATLIVLAAAGCSDIKVNTAPVPGAKFATSGTYAWMQEPPTIKAGPEVDRALLDQRVHTAVEAAMKTRGFTPATSGSPTYLVGYHAAVQSTLDAKTLDEKYGYGATYAWGYGKDGRWGFGPDRQVQTTYSQGSLILDIVDPATKKLLWRGAAEGPVVLSASPEERQKRVDDAARAILAQFPPKS